MDPKIIGAFGLLCLCSISSSLAMMMGGKGGDGSGDGSGGGGAGAGDGGGLLDNLFGGGGDDEDAGGGADEDDEDASGSSSGSSSGSGGRPSLFKPAGTIEENADGSITEHKGGGLSTTTWTTEKKDETPIDCEGSWSANWSSCSSTCEGGQQTKTWATTTWPQHGGNPCPSPRTLYQDCGSGPCSVNWSGSANTSGTPVWEEFSNMKFSGTKLSSHSNTELAQCKQKCIDNTGCGGITTKTGNKCHLYGGDATPNPSSSWFTSYTLTRG